MGAVGRDKLGDGFKVIGQAFFALGIGDVLGGGDVVVARSKEVENAAIGGDSIDERDETFVPLFGIAPVDDGVAGLEDEANRERGGGKFFDVGEHRIDDQ